MFDTGLRQVRMALAMVQGRRIDPATVGKLVADALKTNAEFGAPGPEAMEILGGPAATETDQRDFASRALSRTAARLAVRSPFYARHLAAVGAEPGKLDVTSLRRVPVTTKRDLIQQPDAFRCGDVPPYLATRTTGTTGSPAEIWLSRYEMELWPALGALSAVLRDELRPGDIMQISLSSRATAAMHVSAGSCKLAGVGCRPLGLVSPDEALASLADSGTGATILSTVPSYLAELVATAQRRGMGPADFRLRRITTGGEVLSPSLGRAAAATFGVQQVEDSYSMTEIIPVTSRTCSQRHLHHDLNSGFIELLDLVTGEPAQPGALGTIVVTPFFPYRDCAPVFRYDTRDIARCLPDEPLGCELAGIPATSHILGKADHLVRPGDGAVITSRQLIEAIESLPTAPWPARYRVRADAGRVTLTLPAGAIDGLGQAAAQDHLRAAGLDVELRIIPDDQARALRHTRSDLRETTFADQHVLTGV
jgi:phenylacetate-CoA ligase